MFASGAPARYHGDMTSGDAQVAGREVPAAAERRLARRVAIVLLLKICALVAIWHVWFAAAPAADVRGAATAAHVLRGDGGQSVAGAAREAHARP